jgi:hypothetical protein
VLRRHRYEARAVASLGEIPGRGFLEEVGLHEETFLFVPAEPVPRHLDAEGARREFLRIGQGGDYEEFCVDVHSGEVVSLGISDSSVWHVSASVEKFDKCLNEFEAGFPYGDADSELPEREALADALKRALLDIDGTVCDEDPGFWYSLLSDVAIGDYSDE